MQLLVATTLLLALGDLPHVRVGIADGDIRGADHRALQAAIDYVANLGGGTVEILPGRYQMRNSLTLRSRVHVVGAGEKTVLAMCAGLRHTLAKDLKQGEREVHLNGIDGLLLGDGIHLQDSAGHGFEVTTATLVRRTGPRSFLLSQPAESDYLVERGAALRLSFPVVGGWSIRDASIRNVAIEGNWKLPGSENLGGCRGGGVYLCDCQQVIVEDCIVRHINGDAISWQKNCSQIRVEGCLTEHNFNVGLHPGSGSHHCVVRNNIIRDNGYVGLFVCVGVTTHQFEKNTITNNAGCGISIGHSDTDNQFRFNVVANNAEMAVLFRRDSLEFGAHRNLFEKNEFLDNLGPRPKKSNSRPSSAGKASIVIEGRHEGLIFRDNRIEFSQPFAGSVVLHDDSTPGLIVENNHLKNVSEQKRKFEAK